MKNATTESKKNLKSVKQCRMVGMRVRSGVKAGLNEFGGVDRDPRQRMTSPLDGPGRPG